MFRCAEINSVTTSIRVVIFIQNSHEYIIRSTLLRRINFFLYIPIFIFYILCFLYSYIYFLKISIFFISYIYIHIFWLSIYLNFITSHIPYFIYLSFYFIFLYLYQSKKLDETGCNLFFKFWNFGFFRIDLKISRITIFFKFWKIDIFHYFIFHCF